MTDKTDKPKHRVLLDRLSARNIPYSYVAYRMDYEWSFFLGLFVCREYERPANKKILQDFDDAATLVCIEADYGVIDVDKIREQFVDDYSKYVIIPGCPVPIARHYHFPED